MLPEQLDDLSHYMAATGRQKARADAAEEALAAIGYSEDEQRVMGLILVAMQGIQGLNGRKLRANSAELAQAVHVLQSFVVQAAHARLAIFEASDWWEDE